MKPRLILALGLFLLASQIVQACTGTINWTGNAGDHLWTTKGNWDLNRLPDSSDNVCIGAAFTGSNAVMNKAFTAVGPVSTLALDGALILNSTSLSLNSITTASTTSALTLNNSFLTVSATATLGGSLTLDGGQVDGPGTATIASSGSVTVTANSSLITATTNNQGAIFITGAGAVLTVQGTFNNQTAGAINIQIDGSGLNIGGTLNNAGTIAKTKGPGASGIAGSLLVNTGTVLAQSGILSLTVVGRNTGALNANTGAILAFSGNSNLTLNAGTTLAGSGTLVLNGGVWNLAAPVTVNASTLVFDGLNDNMITGTADLTINHLVTWNQGTLATSSPTPTVTLAKTAVMTITTAGLHSLALRNLDIFGTVNLNGGDLTLSSSNLTVESGATFNIQTDNGIKGAGIVKVGGVLEKTGGTKVSNLALANTFAIFAAGTVKVDSGTLDFAVMGGGTLQNTLTVNSGAILRFSTGNFSVYDATVFEGSGKTLLAQATWTLPGGASGVSVKTATFEFDGIADAGIIQGTADLTVSSPNFIWTGGQFQGAGTLTIPKGVKHSIELLNGTTGNPLVGGWTVNNSGITTIADASNLALGAKATWNNLGGFTFAGGGNITDNGGGGTFINNGSVLKTGPTTNSITFSGAFQNNKTVTVAAGTLNFDTSLGTSTGAFVAQNKGATIGFLGPSTWTLNAGTTMTGKGTIVLDKSATWNLTASLSVQTAAVNLANGSVNGAFDLTLGSTATSIAATFGLVTRSDGTIVVPNAKSTVEVVGGTTLSSCTFDNSGIVTIESYMSGFLMNGNAVFENELSGKVILGARTATAAIFVVGGKINNLGTFTTTAALGADPTQTIDGVGAFSTQGIVYVDASGGTLVIKGLYTQTSGSTGVQKGTISFQGGTTNILKGTFGGTGTLGGAINNTGANLQPGNGVVPGTSPGILNLTGALTQGAGATMTIVIAGKTAGTQYDQINSTSSVALGGKLNLQFGLGFTPSSKQSFNILNFTSSTGNFSSVVTPSTSCSAKVTTTSTSLNVSFTSNNLTVAINPATVSLKVSTQQQFTDTVTNGCGSGVTWKVKEGTAGGKVTSAGLYTAPATAGTFHVIVTSAADPTKSAIATVTVTAAAANGISVSPRAAIVQPGRTVHLQANGPVTWSVAEGISGGSIADDGTYTAASTSGLFHVLATSATDAAQRAIVNISVMNNGKLKSVYVADLDKNAVSVLSAVPGRGTPTGQLQETESLSVGRSPAALAISPQGAYLLSANHDTDDVSLFAISSSDGTLNPVPSRSLDTGTHPTAIAIDAAGQLAFVTNHDSDDISVFSVNSASAQMNFLGKHALASGDHPSAIAAHPGDAVVFVASSGSNSIHGFSYDASGVLTPLNGSPFATGSKPSAALIDPSGKFLFVANRGSGNVSAFAIDARNNTLHEVSGSPFASTKGPVALAMDATGTYLIVAGHEANDVTVYQLDGDTGALTFLSRATLPAAGPSALALDPSGQYLYVTSDKTGGVATLQFDTSTGTLTGGVSTKNSGRASSIVVTSSTGGKQAR